MEQENYTPKTKVFATEAIHFQHRLQNYITQFLNCFNTPKTLMFNKPFLSCISGEMNQINGLIATKKGKIKPIIQGWDINETPSITALDITTLVRIADILNDWKYHFED